jgi:hypothetical protein
MSGPSPSRAGFRAALCHPSVGFTEVSWRWSFGAAFWLLLLFSLVAYLQTLPVTSAQMFLIGSGQAFLALRTLQQILQGSAPRLARALFVLSLGSIAGWIAWAALGRAATMRSLVGRDRTEGKVRLSSLMGLNVLRALTLFLACWISVAVCLILSNANPSNPALPSAILLSTVSVAAIWMGWSILNWMFSLAAIYAAEGCKTFAAVEQAAALCWKRPGSVLVIGLWFGLARIGAACLAALLCLLLLGVIPFGSAAFLAAIGAASLGYFFLADFLYIGRLAAYLSLADLDSKGSLALPAPQLPTSPLQTSSVDAGELILSDVPQPF